MPRPTRKESNLAKLNSSLVVTYCTISILCKKVRNENIMELFGNIHTQKKSKLIMVKNMTQAQFFFFRHFPSIGDLYFMNEKVFFLLDMITKTEQEKKMLYKKCSKFCRVILKYVFFLQFNIFQLFSTFYIHILYINIKRTLKTNHF